MGSHRVTCHPTEVKIPPLPPADAGTRFSDPGGMQGWVDLCYVKATGRELNPRPVNRKSNALPLSQHATPVKRTDCARTTTYIDDCFRFAEEYAKPISSQPLHAEPHIIRSHSTPCSHEAFRVENRDSHCSSPADIVSGRLIALLTYWRGTCWRGLGGRRTEAPFTVRNT